jgi:hypothetical protein
MQFAKIMLQYIVLLFNTKKGSFPSMFMGDVCFTTNYKDLNNLNNNEISNTITA